MTGGERGREIRDGEIEEGGEKKSERETLCFFRSCAYIRRDKRFPENEKPGGFSCRVSTRGSTDAMRRDAMLLGRASLSREYALQWRLSPSSLLESSIQALIDKSHLQPSPAR